MGTKKKLRVFYLHWDEKELKERIKPLIKERFAVSYHFSTQDTAKFEEMPEVFVFSLDRLPSHSRAYAEWVFSAKKRQSIPVIFVDGKPDKVDQAKTKFPKAVFCTSDTLIPAIKKIISTIEK